MFKCNEIMLYFFFRVKHTFGPNKFTCDQCMESFSSITDRTLHIKNVHRKRTIEDNFQSASKYPKLTPPPIKSNHKPKKFRNYINHKSWYPQVSHNKKSTTVIGVSKI